MVTHPRVVTALREQLDAWRAALRDGSGRVGWKLGYDIPEIEELVGPEPVIGHLTTATLLESGASFGATGAGDLRAETELAIEVGAGDAVAGVCVALELVDVTRPPGGLEGIVAGNVFHRAVALGPACPPRLADGREARLSVNGELRDAAKVSADHAAVVAAASELLDAVGERLLPGDRILAGSLTHVPVVRGDSVLAEIDGLGSLTARIA